MPIDKEELKDKEQRSSPSELVDVETSSRLCTASMKESNSPNPFSVPAPASL